MSIETVCQIQEAELAYIEHDFPIEGLNKIAQKEGNAKKPIYQMHKWWARRLDMVCVRFIAPEQIG